MRWLLICLVFLAGCESQNEKNFRESAKSFLAKAKTVAAAWPESPDRNITLTNEMANEFKRFPDVRGNQKLSDQKATLQEIGWRLGLAYATVRSVKFMEAKRNEQINSDSAMARDIPASKATDLMDKEWEKARGFITEATSMISSLEESIAADAR